MRKKATSFIKALSLFLIMTAIFTMSAACKNEDKVIVNSISLDVETLTLYVGDTAELTALTDPEGVILKWSSSDPSIATVDNGTVNAIGEGDAIIEVSSGGKTAQCEVTVRVPLPVLSFSEYSYTILGRENLRVDLNAQNANGKDVLWSVSGNSVSIDDSKNTITDNASYVILNPLEAGLSTVTATVDEVECSFDVEVKDDYELIIGDIYFEQDFILTESTYELDVLLTVNGNESTDYSGIEWTSSNVSIATIENGIISTQNATGEVTITATIDNATATSIFTVYKGIANITDWNLIKDDLNGYYVLTSDINFNKAEVDTIAPYNLTGPSSETSYYPQHSNFAGILDGNGYTISNVKPVSRGGTAGAVDQYTALFGTVAPSGIIRNVSIIGLEGTRCAAGVAFWNEGLIENVYVEMFITNTTSATKNNNQAGLVGKNQGKGKIFNSIAVIETNLNVTDEGGLFITAGIVGFNNAEAVVSNSYAVSNRDIPAIIMGTQQSTAIKYDSLSEILSADFSSFDSDIWVKETGRLPRLQHFDNSYAAELSTTSSLDVQAVLSDIDSTVSIPIASSGLYIYETTGNVTVESEINGIKLVFAANSQASQGTLTITLAADATKKLEFNYTTLEGLTIPQSIDYDMTEGGSLIINKQTLGITEDIVKISLGGMNITFNEQDGNIIIPQLMTDSQITTMDKSGKHSIAILTASKAYTMELLMATKIIKQDDLGGAIGDPAALAAIIFSARIPNEADMPYFGYYVLGEDIVLNSEIAYTYAVGSYKTAFFQGTFDGRGYSITGLKTAADASMFYFLGESACIKNIAFYNANLAGQKTALISNLSRPGAVVENIYAEAKLTVNPSSVATHPTGVIIQKNAGAIIRNCISVLDVTGISGLARVGGISGNTTTILDNNVLITASDGVGIVGTGTAYQEEHIAQNKKFLSLAEFFDEQNAEYLTWFNQDIWNFDSETQTISLK